MRSISLQFRVYGLLGVAVLFFLSGCADSQRQRALDEQRFLEAEALADSGDAPAAVAAFHELTQGETDMDIRSVAMSRMGALLFEQGLTDEALLAFREALACDSVLCDTQAMAYDMRDIANCHRASETADSCITFFDKALRLAKGIGDEELSRDLQSQMAGYYLWKNDTAKAGQLLLPLLRHADKENRNGYFFMAADYYEKTGQQDSALHFNQLLISCGNIFTRQSAHRALAHYCIAQGDLKQALHHLERYEELTDSVISQNDADALRRYLSLYNYQHKELENARLREVNDHRLRLIVIIGAALLIVSLALALAILRHRGRQRIYRSRLNHLQLLLATSHQNQQEDSPKHQQPQFDTTPLGQDIARTLASINPQPLTEQQWFQLEETIDKLYPNFFDQLRDFCTPNVQELRVCMLLKAGYTPVQIALLTAHTKPSISNTRRRLYEKTFGQPAPPSEWDRFIVSL